MSDDADNARNELLQGAAKAILKELVGMTEVDAISHIRDHGLRVRIKGHMGSADFVPTRITLEVDPDTHMVKDSSIG